MQQLPLFTDEYLFSHWEDEVPEYLEQRDVEVRQLLRGWDNRDPKLTETQLDGLFVERIFHKLWDYRGTGSDESDSGYSLMSEHPVSGAGQSGGTGKADLALGYFGHDDVPSVSQVLCEFKDISSSLDAPQNRKGNTRSPVQQCMDYLKHSFDTTEINSTLFPTWGIVTDMNEFRLYFRKAGITQFLRFSIGGDEETALIADTPAAGRKRFLFCKVFATEMLLAPFGRSRLEKLLRKQWTHEKKLEKDFYREYQAYRQHVYESIVDANPGFKGTRGDLVQMTQRFLDRCIFLLFCEDMGKAIDFPTDLLRDLLKRRSTSPDFSAEYDDIWTLIKRLFRTMCDGGPFPPDHQINRFNGGLFEKSEQLEQLRIPNRVFCAKGQGASPEKLSEFKNTLLYLSGTYNFGSHGTAGERTITLYALGRIFEQSITDLEYMHADAEGVPTIATITKRKRDGVYYTPEWVTGYIVQEVVGARLADERRRLALVLGAKFPDADVKEYANYLDRRRRLSTAVPPAKNAVTQHVHALGRYSSFLSHIKIVDPACGSGAFLIQALQFLQQHHLDLAAERARITGEHALFDQEAVIRDILANNLYGVDINPESIEITQLALWLNTAAPGKPLATLDQHIRCGNSLIGPDFVEFYDAKHGELFRDLDDHEREQVNVFDWRDNFPDVLGGEVPEHRRGFDCVIGNPPYVKLQHFRKVKPDESDYYIERKGPDGTPLFESAQTGNFDLYLPFIEKGISLLNKQGLMGYIAPSLWLKNEYGAGLRKKLKRIGALDRWIDFKSFQVFDEATTYTALQFFSGSERPWLRFHLAPDGDIAPIDWQHSKGEIPLEQLDDDESWILLYDTQRRLFNKLGSTCDTLEQTAEGIIVGIQTSADLIYHLEKIGPGQYRQKGSKADGIVHAIEDTIMRPLVSGPDAKRYQVPDTTTCLLFPYDVSGDSPRLWTEEELNDQVPGAWTYLKKYEQDLRRRERGKMDCDGSWWAYNYPKNLDKQELAKLGVAETVPALRLFADKEGQFCFNNVRVNGIVPAVPEDLFYLLGVLNSPVANWYFKKIAKPKDNSYFEANKQFIAPIPIPKASDAKKQQVGEFAEQLQSLHTERRDRIDELQERIDSPQCLDAPQKPAWLWANVETAHVKGAAPADLKGREKTAWTKAELKRRLASHYEKIDARLRPGACLDVQADGDALRLTSHGSTLVEKFGLDESEAQYLAALWRQKLRSINITANSKAEKLLATLLKLRTTDDPGMRKTIIKMDHELLDLDEKVAKREREINTLIYRLYDLTPDEVKLVENGDFGGQR